MTLSGVTTADARYLCGSWYSRNTNTIQQIRRLPTHWVCRSMMRALSDRRRRTHCKHGPCRGSQWADHIQWVCVWSRWCFAPLRSTDRSQHDRDAYTRWYSCSNSARDTLNTDNTGLKISKCKNVCPEWLRWGLGNGERVGNAHCIETLKCHGNTLLQQRSFPRIGYAKRGSSADFCYYHY